jgi:adenine-specific DNA-methyltransferase
MSERVDGPESTTVTENQEQLQELLRDLFQFDVEDLDFGIYRILNQRRDIIEDFIEEDLIETVHEALGEIVEQERHELERELGEAREEVEGLLGENAFDGDDISEQYRDTPVAEDYIEAKEQLERLEVAEETEARIFNDLYRFFSRFYDRGDFHVKRRFSSQDSKYMVPYNGEEVFFHWANRNQYYVKTSEHFTAYRFDTDNLTVEFTVEKANVPQDNVKGDERYFVLGRDPVSWDDDERELTISFQYRRITEEEANKFVQTYNEATGDDRTSFNYKTNTILCTALQQGILDRIDDGELQRELQREEDGETVLMEHLTRYTSENTMDYFIHKDLGGYLHDELDYYLQNEILETDELVETDADREPTSIRRARVVRQIADRIIEFLDQIESFQQRLFEKRKFVSQTDYMVTLDKVPDDLYEEILDNEEQLEQWRDVYNTDEWEGDLSWQGEFTEDVLRDNRHLMIDTALFGDGFTQELLTSFDDIADETDGTLIHGENYQALGLLLEKYRGDIDCCYIDPPYNTGGRDFLYKDNYQHSSWLSMMADRLELSQNHLSDEGAIFTNIDDNEQENLRQLFNSLYGKQNFVANILWQKKYAPQNDATWFSDDHDHVLLWAKDKTKWRPEKLPRTEEQNEQYTNPDDDPRGPWMSDNYVSNKSKDERPNGWYSITNPNTGEEIWPSEDAVWRYTEEQHEKNKEENRVWWGMDGDNSIPRYKRFLSEVGGVVPRTIWSYEEAGHNQAAVRELQALFESNVFSSPKPTKLMKRILRVAPGDTILDYFAGSGTIVQAIMELNEEEEEPRREYILVEMGDYFDTVLRPRIQKLAYSLEWDDGVPQEHEGQSHMVKYQRIESYEDTLNNVVLEEPTDEEQQTFAQNQREEYVSGYMLDFESEGTSLMEPTSFEQPFDHELDIERNGVGRESVAVDLVETFHYLLGADVHRFETYEHQDREYVVTECSVERENSVDSVLTVWRNARDLDIEEEREWVANELEREQFDQMYINSESAVPGAEPVEVTFKTRMEAANDGAE